MHRKWIIRMVEIAAVTLALAAACQELEKPREERGWHGRVVAGIFPYDFRIPNLERLKEAYWNPFDSRIFAPTVFGIGWSINFHALLESLRVIEEDVSEESFLMPTPAMRETMKSLLKSPPETG